MPTPSVARLNFLRSFSPTDLKIASTADNIGHPRVLVGPAEHGPLPGHRVQRSPYALRVLAAPAHDVDHARCFVPAAPREAGEGGGSGGNTLQWSSWCAFPKGRVSKVERGRRGAEEACGGVCDGSVSYTHLTLPTKA